MSDRLYRYRVAYRNSTSAYDWHFLCWADDEDHAREQCLNAEPGSEIVKVELLKGLRK